MNISLIALSVANVTRELIHPNLTAVRKTTIHPTYFPVSDLNCKNPEIFDDVARCRYRDDITFPLQTAYFISLLVNLVLLFPALRNISRSFPQKGHQALLLKLINSYLLAFVLLRILFFSDSLLQVAINWDFPLYITIAVDYASLLILNTAMVIGAHSWISTILTTTFNSKRKFWANVLCFTLCVANVAYLITIIIHYALIRLDDNTKMSALKHNLSALPSITLLVSTATNGIYFIVGCLLLWSYLQAIKTGQGLMKNVREKLSLLAALASFLRMGQSAFMLSPMGMWNVRKQSILNDDWIWAAVLLSYHLVTQFLPAAVFLKKFSPCENLRMQNSFGGGGFLIAGVKTTMFNESDIEREALKFVHCEKSCRNSAAISINDKGGPSRETTTSFSSLK